MIVFFLFSETLPCPTHTIYYKSIIWRLLWEIYLLADATTHAVIRVQTHVEILVEEATTTVAGGLLFFYSFAADAAAIIPVVAMVAAITTTTAAAQSSGF